MVDAAPDARRPVDAQAADAGPRDAGPAPSDAKLTVFALAGGHTVRGEVVAVYDHNRWWHDAGPELTWAVFRPELFEPYPDDLSLGFVSSLSVEALSAEPWPAGRPTYRAVLREQRILVPSLPLSGTVMVTTGNDSYHLEEDGYGQFAWDLVLTDEHGLRHTGDGLANEDHRVWGAEVRLPSTGWVVEVARSYPDNEPGGYTDDAGNNMVGVHLGGSFYLYLLHLQQGSVPEQIQQDRWLPAGTVVGRVGNSGISLEPHLHMAVLWYDEHGEAPRSWGVPAELTGVWAAPAPRGPWTHHDFLVPTSGTWLADDRPEPEPPGE